MLGARWRFGLLWRLDLPRKKTLHAAEQDRPDVAAARDAWRGLHPFSGSLWH